MARGVVAEADRSQAIELPSIDLVSIRDGKWANIRKQGFEDTEEGARAHGFRVMLEKFAHEVRR